MKRVLLVVAMLVCALPSWGAVAHVASGQGYCTNVTFGGNIASTCNAVTTKTFSYTATGTGNAVLLSIACGAASTTNTITLAATGWTITTITGGTGSSGNRMAHFKAYAPNTSAATFTVTSTVSCGTFIADYIDEISGTDLTNITSATNVGSGSGAPSASVTPASNNNMIVLACIDSITAIGAISGSTTGVSAGANDTQGDWSEWKILSGGSGVSQSAAFTGSGTFTCTIAAVQPPTGAAVTKSKIIGNGVL